VIISYFLEDCQVASKFFSFTWILLLLLPLVLLSYGCVRDQSSNLPDEPAGSSLKKVYRGKVRSTSQRTKTITLEIIRNGGPETVELKFNDQTRGIDHAVQQKKIIATGKVTAGVFLTVSIRPDLSGFVAGVSVIKVKKVKKLIAGDDVVVIDSRSGAAYAAGHIPTALSLPSCTMQDHLSRLPEKKNTLLVFYCGGTTCGMSTRGSTLAARAGYTNIKVMKQGITGWTAAGYETVATDAYVKKGGIVLIDLRASRYDTIERIRGSVSIPFDTFANNSAINALSRKAPIVVYSANITESRSALTSLRYKGFRQASMVDGNFQGWKKRGNATTSGALHTKVQWKRIPGKGEVAPAAFNQALHEKGNAVILDVRTGEEARAGKIRGAVHIPLNDLSERMNELAQNRKIYIYSATGARADMAGRQLRENGYNAYFLVADVSCSNGKCVITY
jgi:rhodanese-related sulfurtransferase